MEKVENQINELELLQEIEANKSKIRDICASEINEILKKYKCALAPTADIVINGQKIAVQIVNQ